jgi:uncharacterized membrane protein
MPSRPHQSPGPRAAAPPTGAATGGTSAATGGTASPGTTAPPPGATAPPPGAVELAVARLLNAGTYLSVALLGLGLVAMLVAGISPYAAAPTFDPRRLGTDLLGGRPEAFLWLGLVAAIATPTTRVVLALVRFARGGETSMVAIAVAILAVIALSLLVAGMAGA